MLGKVRVIVVNAQEYQELVREFEEKVNAVKEVIKEISEFEFEIDVDRTNNEKQERRNHNVTTSTNAIKETKEKGV